MRLGRWQLPIGEIIRFCFVGVANTAVYYAFYRLFLLALPYVVAHLLAWAISFVFSFYMNCWFTYRVKPTWGRFVMFPTSAITNVAFTTFGTVFLVESLHISEKLAPLIAGVLAIPVTFAVTRWALKGRGSQLVAGSSTPDEPLADPQDPTSDDASDSTGPLTAR